MTAPDNSARPRTAPAGEVLRLGLLAALALAIVVGEAADGLAAVLERSGAGSRHAPEFLREMVRRELELAAVDIGCLTFGSPRIDGLG